MHFGVMLYLALGLNLLHLSWTRSKELDWWQRGVIYRIFTPSFQDSNCDGVGDLNGIVSRLPYFQSLGVDVIWMSPIFKSSESDPDGDVLNFLGINPAYGTMDDLDNLIREVKKLGMKIIMDYIPNHTSDKHEWFKKSVQRIAPYTDYYVWKDAKLVNGLRNPPNNWLSNSGKSAWEWNEERNQYYYHHNDNRQPDLNYRNPNVNEELKNNMIFWLKKGVDGMSLSSANFLYEDELLRDEPRSNIPNVSPDQWNYLTHNFVKDQPESVSLIKKLRSVFDSYSQNGSTRILITEAYTNMQNVVAYYGTNSAPGAHIALNIPMITDLGRESNALNFKNTIESYFQKLPNFGWPNWMFGNHDYPRLATRYSHSLVDGLHMMQLLLPGTPVIYSGDELGMQDTFVRWEETKDKRALLAGPLRYLEFTRDPHRTPFQWNDSENAGFTSCHRTWLPVNPDYWKVNAEIEQRMNISNWHNYKKIVTLRNSPTFTHGRLQSYTSSEWVLIFSRSSPGYPTFFILINFGSKTEIVNLPTTEQIVVSTVTVEVSSINSGYVTGNRISRSNIVLRPQAGLVLRE